MECVHGGSRKALLLIALTVVTVLAVGVSAAFAQTDAVEIDDQQLVIDLGGTVYAENCDPCHGNIADTDNYSSSIIFQHGYHQLISCSGCHSKFPHQPEGTDVPEMKGCFACHGLQHGPMGELATGKCEDCHLTPVEDLRPADHVWNWAQKPHVEPGEKELQTRCMMCHDEPWCVECHDAEEVRWEPKGAYAYDSAGGCLACHGNENLIKTSEGRPKSYQVMGVDQSAHAKLSCQECHVDYEYEDEADATPIWNVNAGLACMNCHDNMSQDEMDEYGMAYQPGVYKTSIHWTEFEKGNMDSATCSSCHGGHYIQRLDTEFARQQLHSSAYRVCARCHPDEYDSYDDYYHGAAYKRGAADAPACWDCHGDHDVLPSSNAESLMSEEKRAETCGQEGCHRGSSAQDPAFAQAASELIHKSGETAQNNPLNRLIDSIRSWFG